MNLPCASVTPSSHELQSWQKLGLDLVSAFQGRDVVLAVDLTESVGFNDEGRLRLRQIVQDSLQQGDTVYVVPFATQVNPLEPKVDPLTSEKAIKISSKEELEKVISSVPLKPNLKLQNTDIQNAELHIYKGLAQINQCRLADNQPIKPQSVVWLTDAPLNTKPGIPSSVWVETPATSPFRQANSSESVQREKWLESLPLVPRQRPIDKYTLTVVDIKPTVQEFCTPTPGGKETCLVTPYLVNLLGLPLGILALLLILGTTGLTLLLKYLLDLKKIWKVKVDERTFSLTNQGRVNIGEQIECPGGETRGYLKRKGNQVFLEKANHAEYPIFYNGKEITEPIKISSDRIRIECPFKGRDSEIVINIEKK